MNYSTQLTTTPSLRTICLIIYSSVFLEYIVLFAIFVTYYNLKRLPHILLTKKITIMGLIGAIIMGILAGFIANKIMGKGGGLLWDLVLGVIGGFAGGYLFDLLNISLGGIIGQLVIAVVGAVVVLWIASFFRK